MSLATYDLFTDEEFELYSNIIQLINEQDGINNLPKEEKKANRARIKELAAKKRELSDNLNALIKQHLGTPRTVRLLNVLDTRKIRDENGEVHTPPGISWHTLRLSKKIAEFESEESRAMGLCQDEITFDKIILKWKFIDVLEQVVKDGFYVPILNPDGSVTQKKYRCHTASAGQLRTDKVQFLSEEIWDRIHKQLECGMDHEKINSHGGINCNKLLAYEALVSSATDVWDFDIDRCLVIEDFEAEVTGAMKYIKPDYSYEVGEKTVLINHGDGIGMMLPCVSIANFMVRGPYLKGLLSSFDYIRFCKVRGVEPVIKDVWGLEHDLAKENIQVLFTKSQLKLWKYYDSWEHYKKCFKENGCHLCRTNYEEKWIPDTYINYQMLQTLQDFTDDEVRQFTKHEHDRIESLAKNKETMLRVLNAEMDSDDPYREALYLYPALLREAYSRESLKDVKRKMLLDAKSGKIKCKNKRLFAIPDFYAACEFWFLGDKHPKGLLKDGEIACKIYQDHDEADVLRSPHLYQEHAIRKITHDENIYSWFYTNGVYTSCHDLISRILQFDCDGDQLNVVVEPVIVEAAKRNIEKFHVLPLFYDANKAGDEILSADTIFNGLKRAHDYSNIGTVSNLLTKLWNSPQPDWDAAAWLCFFNNQIIDAAKTGKINSYVTHPEIYARIIKATGGKTGKMPYFFQFSKNGRKESVSRTVRKRAFATQNLSTMNRICAAFDDIGNINMNYAGVPPFNWQMLIDGAQHEFYPEAVQVFCQMDNENIANLIEARNESGLKEKSEILGYEFLKEEIIRELNEICGDYRNAYPSIVKHLFTGENLNKASHKRMFWRMFGDMAIAILKENLTNVATCEACGQKVPAWVTQHVCNKSMKGFFECVDCGTICERTNSRQCRCETCQTEHRRLNKLSNKRMHYKKKR